MRSRIAVVVVLAACAARASNSISDEAGVNTTQATPQNPRAGGITNSINLAGDIGEQWTFSAGALVTLEGATPAPPTSAFGDRGALVGKFSAGVEFQPSDEWSFAISGNLSPQSTDRAGTQLDLTSSTGVTSSANALVRAVSSSAGAELTVSYDSAGQSDLEWALDAGIALAHLATDQRIVALETANGTVETTASIIRYCQTHPCSAALRKVISPQPAAVLDSGQISLTGTLTFAADTDVSLFGSYYAYEQDPSQVGYFSIGSAGREQIAGGSGVPIAPLRYLVRPEVAERFGDFSVRLWVQGGRYVAGTAETTRGAGLKLQYKFTSAFRMWATATGQRDVDSDNGISWSWGATLGAGYKF